MTDAVEPIIPGNRPAWGPAGWTLALLVFGLGFVAFPLRILGSEFEYLPGDPIDNRLNNYVLEHGYRYVTGRVDSFWDAPMYYPTTDVTAWSDAHIGMLPFYTAMRAAGLSPERAFQGHFILCFVLNYAAAIWALRRLGFGPAGAIAGAYVFAFALPLSSQLQHTQLYPRFLVPPAIVFAWEFLLVPRAWRIIATAWCWAGQIFISVYIGFFLAVLLAVCGIVAVARFHRELPWPAILRPGRREWIIRTVGVASAIAAVAWLAQQHRRGGSEVPIEHIRLFAPKPMAWITPPSNAGALPELGEWTKLGTGMTDASEQQLCPGLIPLLMVALGAFVLIRPARLGGTTSVVAVTAFAALMIGLSFTQFGDVWLYEWLADLPGAKGIRAIGRVVLVLLFPASIAIAAGMDYAVHTARRGGFLAAGVAAIMIFGAIAFDQSLSRPDGPRATGWGAMRFKVDDAVSRQARISEAIRNHPNPKVLYAFPSAGDGPAGRFGLQLEAMRASQDLGIPCVNGWSGHCPSGWDFFIRRNELMVWLTVDHSTSTDDLAGLVIVGKPGLD